MPLHTLSAKHIAALLLTAAVMLPTAALAERASLQHLSGLGLPKAMAASSKKPSKSSKSKKKPAKPNYKKFAGFWRLQMSRTVNTCDNVLPEALRIDLKIDSKLVGTDRTDNSSLLTGRVVGDTITFNRRIPMAHCSSRQQVVITVPKVGTPQASFTQATTCNRQPFCNYGYAGSGRKDR